jgi:hypothetical protein
LQDIDIAVDRLRRDAHGHISRIINFEFFGNLPGRPFLPDEPAFNVALQPGIIIQIVLASLSFRRVPPGPLAGFNSPIGVLIAAARLDFAADGADVTAQSLGDRMKRAMLREQSADFLSL